MKTFLTKNFYRIPPVKISTGKLVSHPKEIASLLFPVTSTQPRNPKESSSWKCEV